MNFLDLLVGSFNQMMPQAQAAPAVDSFNDRFNAYSDPRTPPSPMEVPGMPPAEGMGQVPMPQPRPPMVDAPLPPAPPAPPALFGSGPAPQPAGPMASAAMPQEKPTPPPGLLGLGMDPEQIRRISNSIGMGLSEVRSNRLPGEGLARGLGGSFQGANKFDDAQDDRKQKALDSAIRMRGQDLDAGYRSGTLGVAQQNADTSRFSAVSQDQHRRNTRTIGGGNRSVAQDIAEADREVERRMRRFPALPIGATEQERTAHEERQREEEERIRERVYRERGLTPGSDTAPPARRGAAPSSSPSRGEGTGPVDVADVEGQGTQSTPFRPRSRQEYDALPSGTYFVHRDGTVRLKP